MRPSRTNTAPSLTIPRFESAAPRRGPRPRSVNTCDAPTMRSDPLKPPISMPNPALNDYAATSPKKCRGAALLRPRSARSQPNRDLVFLSSLCDPTNYAEAAFPLNAGANTSLANVSIDVGVVFAALRASSAFMCPLFSASHISTMHFAKIPAHPHLRHGLDELLVRHLHVLQIRLADRVAQSLRKLRIAQIALPVQFLRLRSPKNPVSASCSAATCAISSVAIAGSFEIRLAPAKPPLRNPESPRPARADSQRNIPVSETKRSVRQSSKIASPSRADPTPARIPILCRRRSCSAPQRSAPSRSRSPSLPLRTLCAENLDSRRCSDSAAP